MLWSFVAVCFSAWLFINSSYHGPIWQCWLFKPITLLLLLLLACQAPMINITSYLIPIGLSVSLIGDILTFFRRQRLLYVMGFFFLSHLIYAIYFTSQITLTFFWPLPMALLTIGALFLTTIWTKLEEMRWPICTFITMALIMVWRAGELQFFHPTEPTMSAFSGAVLLLISNIVWLESHYLCRFRADKAIAAGCYFAGHFLIVRSLYII